jgi:hypothetical protein
LSATYKVVDGVLHAVAEQRTEAMRIPVASIGKYLEMLRAARQEAGKQIVLKKS